MSFAFTVALVALSAAMMLSGGVASQLAMRGHYRLARLCAQLTVTGLRRDYVLLTCDLDQGLTADALARIDRLVPRVFAADPRWQLLWVNAFLNVLVNAGHYREALRWRRIMRKVIRAYPGDEGAVLIIVNSIEAVYNLGRWQAAERICLSALKNEVTNELLGRAALRVQLAWVLSRTGRFEAAKRVFARAPVTDFPFNYRAECLFTEAAMALAQGDTNAAMLALERGELVAVRASSKRNAEFLRAEILLGRGDSAAAEAAFRRAASHRYRGQGGHSLATWSTLLTGDEAARVKALVLERDPESEAARRLGAPRVKREPPGPVLEVRGSMSTLSKPSEMSLVLTASTIALLIAAAFASFGKKTDTAIFNLVLGLVFGAITVVNRRRERPRLRE